MGATGSATIADSTTQPPPRAVAARGGRNQCENIATSEVLIDGLLDDWKGLAVIARAGAGAVELRCAWDGTALALALDIKDDRVVRARGKADEDRVEIAVAAGGSAAITLVHPGNAIASSKRVAPAHVEVADSLQPKGFSVELLVPSAAIPEFSAATASIDVRVTYHDSDQATGGNTKTIVLVQRITLGDRADLLADFLTAARLRAADLTIDTLAELDPDRPGKERLVAGGTVIGVLTDQFAFVTLPAAAPTDVREVKMLPLGPRGQQVVSALVRQTGNGGSRDLLMLWTVWSGQLQPLAQIEVRKQLGGNVLESTWKLGKAKHGAELVVEPTPAIGFTAETWNETPSGDSDSILLPWDPGKAGVAYSLTGAELVRRDLPVPVPKRKRRAGR